MNIRKIYEETDDEQLQTKKMSKLSWLLLGIPFFLVEASLVRGSVAQTTPPANIPEPILPEPRSQPDLEPLPPPEELLQPPTAPTPEPESPTIPGTITVREFEVVGSTVFDEEELAQLLAEYTNRPLTFAELLAAQQAVTRLYQQRGYITSGAFIPPQALENGTVTIQVVEGEIEEIEISGLDRLKPGYVRSRLENATKAPLNQQELLTALQLLQLDPLIERLSVELTAGTRPGVSRLEVFVEDAPGFYTELGLDNQRSPSVGSHRRIIQIGHNNLLGWGDRLNVSYYNTDGSNTLDDISYTVPINARDGTISFSHRRTESEIIEEPFNELDIISESRTYQLSYRQPVYRTPNTEFAVGVTGTLQESETSLLGIPFPLSAGAENDGETTVTSLRFFQEYTTRTAQQVFAARSQFSLGIDAFDATINEENPDGRYFSWRGQAQYLRLLAPDTVFLLRSDLQVADRPLVPLEQFSLGGQLSVRGYRQDVLLADSGFFASAEVRVPIARIREWDTILQVTPFFDFGTVWNNNEIELEEQTISSVGLGLQLLIGDNFVARLDWGIPLVELETTGDSLQEEGIYFSIRYSPF
ncbi:MAG: ShlB/FhaC/HecB family hemolysin secretion/activation protein [Oscillatoria sp. PMC 1050.18]|nr:ShlB/FhaC/HecB family hemolysin secretion/activation protein [Oscillatoria sp. PMC 1050.18]